MCVHLSGEELRESLRDALLKFPASNRLYVLTAHAMAEYETLIGRSSQHIRWITALTINSMKYFMLQCRPAVRARHSVSSATRAIRQWGLHQLGLF